jgi:prevent-host-death family protein
MTNLFNSLPSVSMMDLRNNPGRIVDRVNFQNEYVVIERGGKPMVAVVPLREVLDMQRRRKEAKERFWQMTQEVREKFADVDPQELEQAINKALEEVRIEQAR